MPGPAPKNAPRRPCWCVEFVAKQGGAREVASLSSRFKTWRELPCMHPSGCSVVGAHLPGAPQVPGQMGEWSSPSPVRDWSTNLPAHAQPAKLVTCARPDPAATTALRPFHTFPRCCFHPPTQLPTHPPQAAAQLWQDITSGAAEQEPSRLCRFQLLAHGDLKQFHFHYW